MLQFVREVLKRKVQVQRRRVLFDKLARLAPVFLRLRLRQVNRHLPPPRRLTILPFSGESPSVSEGHVPATARYPPSRWFTGVQCGPDVHLAYFTGTRAAMKSLIREAAGGSRFPITAMT
jgi:hypothetical protein